MAVDPIDLAVLSSPLDVPDGSGGGSSTGGYAEPIDDSVGFESIANALTSGSGVTPAIGSGNENELIGETTGGASVGGDIKAGGLDGEVQETVLQAKTLDDVNELEKNEEIDEQIKAYEDAEAEGGKKEARKLKRQDRRDDRAARNEVFDSCMREAKKKKRKEKRKAKRACRKAKRKSRRASRSERRSTFKAYKNG
jgi:hypothetical protein|tara:strand:- start:710 stop:1297 length:588 start_codon:yes stop_codon:yes gene_type:complete